tara:strand:- start:594 stop:803 length:210 start_codon:yes stop_codon:yes gene_type:complete
MPGRGIVTKNSGSVGGGKEELNMSLGKGNPTPTPADTRGKTVKTKGVQSYSIRFPYDSSKGEIRDHTNG